MQQHPVPQQISSYQFHLVGDMTLKQFLQLAGGVIVGILIYATNLPIIIKWPLILISVGIGAALAFLPFEERPLEQWVVAFFRSIYSPTLFNWNKAEVKIFQDEEAGAQPLLPNLDVNSKIPFLANLENAEKKILSQVTQFFAPGAPVQPTPQPTSATLGQGGPVQQPANSLPTPETFAASLAGSTPAPNFSNMGVEVQGTVKQEVTVPQNPQAPVIEERSRPIYVVEENKSTGATPQITDVNQTLTGKPLLTALPQNLNFSADAAPPSPPTITNTIVGQVMDPDGKIIEGAILEILDSFGRPVRAIRTNRAGHFLTATPLMNGKYELVTEKDGFTFAPLSFEAIGQMIPPIAIRAKGRQVYETTN